jgi:hypothetical protein
LNTSTGQSSTYYSQVLRRRTTRKLLTKKSIPEVTALTTSTIAALK